MESYIADWLNLLVRWLHLISGIAWIGSSFYFVWLDEHLTPPANPNDLTRGVSGELWSVHGGGFYHNQKFLLGPTGEPLTEDLHWFKWEAYTTWLSGMGLLALIYWWGASSYLIDKTVMNLSPGLAVAISIGLVVGAWLIYDTLCKRLGKNEALLAGVVFVFIMFAAWALFQVFSPRAAYIHVGVMMGTMMVANVVFVIIPGQRKMVEDIRARRPPDPLPGLRGKTRSVHNTYFTLPVLFIMISNHYPMTYSHRHGWLVLMVIILAGVLIRQFFVLRHKGRTNLALPAIAGVMLLGLAVVMAPKQSARGAAQVAFAKVHSVITQRCVPCHAAQPTQPGFVQPPKGILLQTADQISAQAAKIHETVGNRYMPIANLTQMTDEERALIATWFAQGAKVN